MLLLSILRALGQVRERGMTVQLGMLFFKQARQFCKIFSLPPPPLSLFKTWQVTWDVNKKQNPEFGMAINLISPN